jgi:hypothetical protein
LKLSTRTTTIYHNWFIHTKGALELLKYHREEILSNHLYRGLFLRIRAIGVSRLVNGRCSKQAS